ncbi:polysaccharide biosynthesis tyrosine autokinase [Agrococcus sp. Marseille-Q4369]|uniref:polysaccharide biosynthesis tyrosine autokinase n=1 Tax=Agrococcus sp. Marseille-Q4369 TaxID=2810513 RepID=UPI001B8B6BD4|nr:polysaccharide biosynthesis tyrosine autokinase [Agrococcus sp. Marseille-Q4369]QUW18946.1 polysaccharide biosynthesis tyrosine autokinase [Agrococcus sp. Marseille-Q4369]
MTLTEYAAALRKHWLSILLLAVLGAGGGWGVSKAMPDTFRAETSVMVIPSRGDSTSELVQGSNYVQNLVQTYTLLARSPTVLQPVVDELDIPQTAGGLAARTDVEAPLNTFVIEIGVSDASGAAARTIADAVAAQFSRAVADVSPEGPDGEPAVRVEVIAPAREPSGPIAPNTRLNTLLGGASGLAVGVLAALVLRRFGSRLTSVEDLQEASADIPVLGRVGRADGRGLVPALREHEGGRVAESVRQMTAALKYVDLAGERRVLLVTSGSSGEGKSSVSVGLALTLADVGHRVLLVDADLRRSSIADLTGVEGAVGLTTVLVGDVTLPEAVQPWGSPDLEILASGPKPPNPGHLLTSDRLTTVLAAARSSYDYVIVDTAPVLAVSDALWLASESDGIIVVARADRTRREALRRTLTAVAATPARILGVVLNGVVLPRTPYDRPRG